MQTPSQIKQTVKERYAEIADKDRDENASGCCGVGTSCSTIDEALMAEDYSRLKGYVSDADLGLGCGLPTQFAKIKEGDTVIDLGSGAGNDCFIARAATGPTGKVIGVDFTEKMIAKARTNAEKLGYNNLEFRLGDIENLPVSDNVADVVVSNCVLNLVPDKHKALSETFRVLRQGGHFSVSDIVLEGHLPASLRNAAEMYVGCVSGAIQKSEYLRIIDELGFENIQLQKEKQVDIPDEILRPYISEEDLKAFRESGARVLSITVYGEKPLEENVKKHNKTGADTCCEPGCCGN